MLQTLVAANDVQKFNALQLFKVIFAIIKRSKVGDEVWHHISLDTHQSVARFRNTTRCHWTLSDNAMLLDWDGLKACLKCFERLLKFESKYKQQLRSWLRNYIFERRKNHHSHWNFQKLFQKSKRALTRKQCDCRIIQICCSASSTLRRS